MTLPEGAAVSRFAIETHGKLVEAEVVEKQLARRVSEDFLHRRQDPALLEKATGDHFSARNQFSQGPMGCRMGLLQIQWFDGEGEPRFENRSYVIMTNYAFVDLGSYPKKK